MKNNMEDIDIETFNSANLMKPTLKSDVEAPTMSEQEFSEMMADMANPIKAKKELAVRVKHFLDKQIDKEMSERGYLSPNTRSWVDTYERMLSNLQKDLHGDKSVNLHIHKLSHSEVAAKMREPFVIKENVRE